MKRRFLPLPLAGAFAGLIFSSYAVGPYNGGAGNHTGSAGSVANCSTGSGCHAGNNAATVASIMLISPTNDTVKDGKYLPGTLYQVLVQGTNPSSVLSKFGFQVSCVDAFTTNVQKGTFSSSNSKIGVRNYGSLELVEHNTPLAAKPVGTGNSYEAVFNWLAPAAGAGKLRFYLTLNAVNGNTTSSGDQPNAALPVDFDEMSTGILSLEKEQTEIFPNPVSNNLSIRIKNGTTNWCFASIYNLQGKKISSESLHIANGMANLNVANLLPGAYFLQILTGNGRATAAFIKP